MPLVLYAARALPTLKSGYLLVRRWNALPPEERAKLQEQGLRTVRAIMAVKVAVTAEGSAADPPANWQAAFQMVRQAPPAEQMAKAVVAYLQKVPVATVDEIARSVGAVGKDDFTFKSAMEFARRDGYVRRSGVTLRGIKWDTTEWADLRLLDTPHARQVEAGIVTFVEEVGLASIDHIGGELGLENDSAELLAALERAVADGSVVWYCNGIYGLSRDRLEGFEPKRDLWRETLPAKSDKDLGSAVAELESAVKGLSGAMKSDGDETGGATEPDVGGDAPYECLRQIQGLRDAGVLTEEEYAAKKAEILTRI
jgi:hypothetical protein